MILSFLLSILSYALLYLFFYNFPEYLNIFWINFYPETFIIEKLIKENKIEIIKKLKIESNCKYLLLAMTQDHFELFKFMLLNYKNFPYDVVRSEFLTKKYLNLLLPYNNFLIYYYLRDEELKKYLISFGLTNNEYYFKMYEIVIKFNLIDDFKLFYKNSTKNGFDDFNPLLTACRYGAYEIAEFLLDQNVIIHKDVLLTCVLHDNINIVEKLLKKGIDENFITNRILELSSEQMYDLLVKYKYKPQKLRKRNRLLDMNDENNQCVIFYDIPKLNSKYYRCTNQISHVVSVYQLICPYCKYMMRNVVYTNK